MQFSNQPINWQQWHAKKSCKSQRSLWVLILMILKNVTMEIHCCRIKHCYNRSRQHSGEKLDNGIRLKFEQNVMWNLFIVYCIDVYSIYKWIKYLVVIICTFGCGFNVTSVVCSSVRGASQSRDADYCTTPAIFYQYSCFECSTSDFWNVLLWQMFWPQKNRLKP